MALNLNFTFDDNTYRHFLNGEAMVLHCHHYISLYAKLAEEMADYGGPRILKESAEDSFGEFLKNYVDINGVNDPAERLAVGSEFYSLMGLGVIEISGDKEGGEANLKRSHVDEGWVNKWGKNHKFINHVTAGYVAAVFSVAYGEPLRKYDVTEVSSIAMGEENGRMTVKRK